MKQILQSLKTGQSETIELPLPACQPGELLIRSRCSLVSPGTERMLANFGKASWLDKARQHPDKVRQVLQKIRTDGLASTVKAVRTKLDRPVPVGYSNVGVVLEVGAGVTAFSVGDRVVSNGYHAEVVSVPENLCATIPDEVSDEEAAFTVLGAISLQGVRLAEPTLGESFVVYGLGLIGLLTAQILRANGCKVIGVDLRSEPVEAAQALGIQALTIEPGSDPKEPILSLNGGSEVDGVLITASTSSKQPILVAPQLCRKRGRIILVGVVGLELDRSDFYHKELSFQVSCSYGPGRYENEYEQKGYDYPIGFVRWTEQRNFEAVLELLRSKSLLTDSLITERMPFREPSKEYDRILSEGEGVGYLFEYRKDELELSRTITLVSSPKTIETTAGAPKLSFVGAGNYARAELLPSFKSAGAAFAGISTKTGISGADVAKKYGFQFSTTETETLFSDENTEAVVIATRHDTHASLVTEALKAKKHVFVEKPLCLTREELSGIKEAYQQSSRVLMVGFNRRYAPLSQTVKKVIEAQKGAIAIEMRINAGAIPQDHWTQQKEVGGGRVVGELCHFIDLAHYFAGGAREKLHALSLNNSGETVTVSISFDNGSIASIQYFANGHKGASKEKIEVFCNGKILEIVNFQKLNTFGVKAPGKSNGLKQDKGQAQQAKTFLELISGKRAGADLVAESAFESMESTFAVIDALS